jgi:hypothetical protein
MDVTARVRQDEGHHATVVHFARPVAVGDDFRRRETTERILQNGAPVGGCTCQANQRRHSRHDVGNPADESVIAPGEGIDA